MRSKKARPSGSTRVSVVRAFCHPRPSRPPSPPLFLERGFTGLFRRTGRFWHHPTIPSFRFLDAKKSIVNPLVRRVMMALNYSLVTDLVTTLLVPGSVHLLVRLYDTDAVIVLAVAVAGLRI